MISEKELTLIQDRANAASAGPWKAFIEGRDHTSGSHVIMTGTPQNRGEDLEIIGATTEDYDFIAHARQDIPKLIEDIKRLTKNLAK